MYTENEYLFAPLGSIMVALEEYCGNVKCLNAE